MSNENAPKFKYPDINPSTGLYQEDYLIKYEQKTVDTACARINKWCRYLFCGDMFAKIPKQNASEVYSYSETNIYMQTLQIAKMALNENMSISASENYTEAAQHLNQFLEAVEQHYPKKEGQERYLKDMKKDIAEIMRQIQRIAVCKQREEEVNQVFPVGGNLKVIILALNQSISEAIKKSASIAATENQTQEFD